MSKIDEAALFKCEPDDWKWLNPSLQLFLGWLYLIGFSVLFLVTPVSVLISPFAFLRYPIATATWFLLLFIMSKLPTKEWPAFRKGSQLWYKIFNVSTNMSPEIMQKFVKDGTLSHFALAMHPHGIIPFHGLLWSAFCDQYLKNTSTGESIYGFGAVADVVMELPFLRTLMGWLSCDSAKYNTLKAGLSQGICSCVNKTGRKPRHLFILPGGIAEIFTSTPGKNIIIFNKRRGLIKLALETGTHLIPCYVFGGTDYFHNFATGEGILSKLGRKYRIGVTMFFGRLGLPIPFSPQVTMCFADLLPVTKWTGHGAIPEERIEALHVLYIDSLKAIFEKYKSAAGHPDAQLEIR